MACFSPRVRKRAVALLIKYCAKRLAKWKRRTARESRENRGFFAASFCKSSIGFLSRRFIRESFYMTTFSPFSPFFLFLLSSFFFSPAPFFFVESCERFISFDNRTFITRKDIEQRGIGDVTLVTIVTWLISDQRGTRVISRTKTSHAFS